ncbi:ycf20-like protein isoform X1 [Pistacia vera]|uniref:ycf20-like protein isoform X1 n=1 Tax=Pistacia vera TaxID=55513 RepID=UPI001262C904|nr:ycf20-like protein isoform X1 [Pistacia vera]
MMTTITTLPKNPRSSKLLLPESKYVRSRAEFFFLAACSHKTSCALGSKFDSRSCFIHVAQPYLVSNIKRFLFKLHREMAWSVRSSVDGSGFDPSSTDSPNGRTRLIRAIQSFQTKLGARIQEIRKDLPMKLLFFLVGFYCATAFATVIGQTGDWDILSAALAVVVVEAIGALMYRASLPLVSKLKSLITMFNYWKAGLSLGLFLDSFKYEMDNIIESSNPFNFQIDIFSIF